MVAEKVRPITVRLDAAAEYCGVSERTVRNWAERGWVRTNKVGRMTLYFFDDLVRVATGGQLAIDEGAGNGDGR